MKKCTLCNIEKTLDCFAYRKIGKGQKQSRCKDCFNSINRKRYSENINGMKDRGRTASKRYNYKNRYNLSDDKIDSLLKDSNGNCEICKKSTKLFVDHCHDKKSYRGLLCRNCNLMLGYAKDNIETLIFGAKYLNTFKCQFS